MKPEEEDIPRPVFHTPACRVCKPTLTPRVNKVIHVAPSSPNHSPVKGDYSGETVATSNTTAATTITVNTIAMAMASASKAYPCTRVYEDSDSRIVLSESSGSLPSSPCVSRLMRKNKALVDAVEEAELTPLRRELELRVSELVQRLGRDESLDEWSRKTKHDYEQLLEVLARHP